MNLHEYYMQRSLELAAKGIRSVAPNPMVGALIVHQKKIIGEGYHQQYGGPHAEVNAIHSLQDQSLLKESILYVTLEPCAHHGKTPPCADLIIKHQIPHVVIACRDPFDAVNGKGIEKLLKADVQVDFGVLENAAIELNRRFFTFHRQKRPFILLKWAQTLDGFMDRDRTADEAPHVNWISHPDTKKLVHKWRSEEQAIMVGTNTVLHDDPELTVREVAGHQPLRIVLDRTGRIPQHAKVFNDAAETLIIHAEGLAYPTAQHGVPIAFGPHTLHNVLQELHSRNIQSVMVEGGQQLLQSFIAANLWDEARAIVGEKTFGTGLVAPKIPTEAHEISHFGIDKVMHYKNG